MARDEPQSPSNTSGNQRDSQVWELRSRHIAIVYGTVPLNRTWQPAVDPASPVELDDLYVPPLRDFRSATRE